MRKGGSAFTLCPLILTATFSLHGGDRASDNLLFQTPRLPRCPRARPHITPDSPQPRRMRVPRRGARFLPVKTKRPGSLGPGVFPEPCKRPVLRLRAALMGKMKQEDLFLPFATTPCLNGDWARITSAGRTAAMRDSRTVESWNE